MSCNVCGSATDAAERREDEGVKAGVGGGIPHVCGGHVVTAEGLQKS